MAMVTAKNETSSGTDLYVTLGYEGTATAGWMAVGAGEQMAGALMFLVIADKKKGLRTSVASVEGEMLIRSICRCSGQCAHD